MQRSIRWTSLLLLAAVLTALPAQARQAAGSASSDRAIVESTMRDVRSAVQDVFDWVGRQVGEASFALQEYEAGLNRTSDLDEVEEMLDDARRQIRSLKREARRDGHSNIERKLGRVEQRLDQLVKDLREIERDQRKVQADDRREVVHSESTRKKIERTTGLRIRIRADRDDDRDRTDRERRDRDGDRRDHRRDDRHDHRYGFGAHNDFGYGVNVASPEALGLFGAQPFYSTLPGLRYNRVEGFVLGLDVSPIHLTSSRRSKIYGQLGYAFALDDIRYQVGFETNLGRSWQERSRLGLKLGAAYHENTETDDTWKIDPVENALAAFLFRHDFFDYYETEGWTVYMAKYMRALDASFRVGYLSDEYRTLDKETDWSIFAPEDRFRDNPAIDEGDMRSVLVQLESGEVYGFRRMPSGAAFRATAEFGQEFGGGFDFNRYIFDGRIYTPINNVTSFGLRGRAGYATEFAPLQKQFTIGGVGSVRAYPQNSFIGTKMFVGNAELAFDNVDVLVGDLSLFGFADFGWLGDDFDRFDIDDAVGAAGFGVGFDDSRIRFELAWPLDDTTVDGPTLWFRINPTF